MESGTCDEALIAGAAACRVDGIPRHACIASTGAAAARGLDVEGGQVGKSAIELGREEE